MLVSFLTDPILDTVKSRTIFEICVDAKIHLTVEIGEVVFYANEGVSKTDRFM